MTILVFDHEGLDVATSSWSAFAKYGHNVTIRYERRVDGWFRPVSGVRWVTLNMGMIDFLGRIRNQVAGTVDLRPK